MYLNLIKWFLFLHNFLFIFATDMRRDVQEIFRSTPHEKQVMMFSATLSKDIRPVCKKFMQDVRRTEYHLHYLQPPASTPLLPMLRPLQTNAIQIGGG